ncbi:hypothetical protein LXL04_021941 [Taraxacum kok-saghyz]
MVFTSLPSYLDPLNWHQQQSAGGVGLGVGAGGDHEISQLPPPLLPPPPPGSSGDGRFSYTTERGRMGKLPQPETAMKCPRCESTNTKFCYFNNYSLSQPRHFCKTCRRYWTRGGALRNVPVGGGCRRNKKSSKGSRVSRSKSPIATTTSSTSNNTTDRLGHHTRTTSEFPILPPLHLYEGGDLGLTFGVGNGTDLINLGPDSNYPTSKFANFPFLEATNINGGILYGEGPSSYSGHVEGMKIHENHHHHHHLEHQGLNLSRNFLGISGNEQFMSTSNVAWGTSTSGLMNGFTSSSNTTTTHIL